MNDESNYMRSNHTRPVSIQILRISVFNPLNILFSLCTILFLCGCQSQTTESTREEPTSTFKDVDGNTYKVKKVGNKYWIVDNFRALKSSSGQPLQGVYSYNDSISNTALFGRLYTWNAAVEATPPGWRLPTKDDWEELFAAQGGTSVAGGNLKETGTTRWNSPNAGAKNSAGLSLVGSGFRGPDGTYYDLGKHGSYWGTANQAQDPFCVYLYYNYTNVKSEVSPIDKTSGIAFAVRYVKE